MVPTRHGFTLRGAPGMEQSRRGEATIFEELASQSEIVIDVGANVGYFSLLAARIGRPVVSIEPGQANLRVLLHNIEENAASCEVLALAVSDWTGVARFYGGLEGGSLIAGWGNMLATYSRLVPVNTLDNLLADRVAGRKALIKLDVEGAEFAAVQGAGRLLSSNPAPTWIVEHTASRNHPNGKNPHYFELLDLFATEGYLPHDLSMNVISRSEFDHRYSSGLDGNDVNVYFWKPE